MIQIPWFKTEMIGVLSIADADGKFSYHVLKSSFKKGHQRLGNYRRFEDLAQLSDYCSSTPVLVLIDGKAILLRETTSKDVSPTDLLQQFLPHAREDEFQCQVFDHPSSDGYRVSIARNDSINNLLLSMSSAGIVCKSLICGIPVSGDELTSHKGLIDGTAVLPDNSSAITKPLAALSWALCNDVKQEWKFTSPESIIFETHRREYRYFHWTKKILLIAPPILLLVLMVNLFVYDHLESDYVVVQSELQAHRSQLDSIANLEDILKQRSMVTGTTDQTGSIPAAYYADQIGGTIPSDVVLTELDIFPLIREEETGKAVSMSFDTVQILGSTKSSDDLNTWIQKMNSLAWVDRISIRDFQQSSTDEAGIFELQLTTK